MYPVDKHAVVYNAAESEAVGGLEGCLDIGCSETDDFTWIGQNCQDPDRPWQDLISSHCPRCVRSSLGPLNLLGPG